MLINLTPHPINLPGRILPSEGVARVSVALSDAGAIDGIPLVRGVHGPVTGLPEPQAGTIFVVSALVRAALPQRFDLASPANLTRDTEGRITGCEALEIN
jgi:hypothetical protein